MELEFGYWYFQKIFNKKFCNKIIKHALKKKQKTAITGQKEMLIGALNGIIIGIGQKNVSLLFILKINIMIGIKICLQSLIKNQETVIIK